MTPRRWLLLLGLCGLVASMWLLLIKGLDAPPPLPPGPAAAPPAPLPPQQVFLPVAPTAPPPAPLALPIEARSRLDTARFPVALQGVLTQALNATIDGGRPNVPWGFGIDGGLRYHPTGPGIGAAVRGGIPDIKHCYDAWLKVQPQLQGRLVLHFTIGTDDAGEGSVSGLSLGDAGTGLGNAAMERCVLQVFEELKFEAPVGGTLNVSYPVSLLPEDSGP